MAQSPAGRKATASSQIHVRIPSVAVINLGKNNSKTVSLSPNSGKLVTPEITSVANVLSNRKWSVTVCREKNTADTYSPGNPASKSTNIHSSSVTIIYVTSLN